MRPPDEAFARVPDFHWVEVIRIARLVATRDDYTSGDLSMAGQVWFWRALGSGVWWNVGRSLVVASDDYVASGPRRGTRGPSAVTCWQAKARGFDSIQLTRSFNGFSYELLDCRGAARPDARQQWVRACPPAHVELLAGVPARRYAPALAPTLASSETPCRCREDGVTGAIGCAE